MRLSLFFVLALCLVPLSRSVGTRTRDRATDDRDTRARARMRVHVTAFSRDLIDDDVHPAAVAFALVLIVATALSLVRRMAARRTCFIDTHVHLWSEMDGLPPWLVSDPALASIAVTHSIDDHAIAAGRGLTKAVYMEVDVAAPMRDAEAERIVALIKDPTNALAGAVIGAPVVDGSLDEFAAYARRWAREPAVKGVRQVLHIHPRKTCLRSDVVAKAKLCGELDLVFELCMRCDELADAAELAAQAPQCRFVLDHCGGHHQLTADAGADKRKAWEEGIRKCAKLPNVWCKLSGLMGAQGGAKGSGSGVAAWSPDEQLVTMRFCQRAFEPNRLIYGGDWPVSTLTAPLNENISCMLRLLADEDEAVRAMVLRENAMEVYRL